MANTAGATTSETPDPSNYVETFLMKLKDGSSLKLSTE